MAKMNFRFRKSIPIIPGILRFTVSKKGYSFNFRLGPLSKSWGSLRNTTTIDAPGTSGIFWRKETSKAKLRKEAELNETLNSHAYQQMFLLSLWVSLITWAIGIYQIYLHPFKTCAPEAGLAGTLSIIVGIEVVFFFLLFKVMKAASGLGGIIILGLACYLQWLIFGHFISPNLHCK